MSADIWWNTKQRTMCVCVYVCECFCVVCSDVTLQMKCSVIF